MRTVALLLAVTVPASAQERKKPGPAHPKVNQARVDRAIENGLKYLMGQVKSLPSDLPKGLTVNELVLWTFVKGGLPRSDPAFRGLLDDMLKRPLALTYCVALQAMVLEELDRVKYHDRIAQCAQALVDGQCQNGQWSYWAVPDNVDSISKPALERDVATTDKGKQVPVLRMKTRVTKKHPGPATGDNSNTQYAALGLRACHDAGVALPAEVVDRAIAWWREAQEAPEEAGKGAPNVATGGGAWLPPAGWGYQKGEAGCGSMTAGAVGGLAIYLYIKDGDGGRKASWKRDKDVVEGLSWMAKNFSVTVNPGVYHDGSVNTRTALYCYLYALERAGMLFGTEWFGTHEWYPEAANLLLNEQRPDGSWDSSVVDYGSIDPIVDTCFAILILRRGTRPLQDVASVDRFVPK